MKIYPWNTSSSRLYDNLNKNYEHKLKKTNKWKFNSLNKYNNSKNYNKNTKI